MVINLDEVKKARFHHIVLLATCDRCFRFKTYLSSLVENVNIYKYPSEMVEVVIVDDSKDKSNLERNKEIVKEIQESAGGITLHYYGPDKQEEFLDLLKEKCGYDVYRYVYAKGNQKGFGGVRNLLLMLGLFHSRLNTIFTFHDDDETFKVVVYNKVTGRFSLKHEFSYFEKIDEVFSTHGFVDFVGGKNSLYIKSVNIASGFVTRDYYESAWIIPHFLLLLRKFFELASSKNPDENADETKILLKLRKAWGEPGGFNFIANFQPGTYAKCLKILAHTAEGMKRMGAYRLFATAYDPSRPLFINRTEYSSGGNTSFRRSVIIWGIPFPVTTARGEDALWGRLSSRLLGGIYYVNVPIGHFRASRSASHRRDVIDEFRKSLDHLLMSYLTIDSGGPYSVVPGDRHEDIVRKFKSMHYSDMELNWAEEASQRYFIYGCPELPYGLVHWIPYARAVSSLINDPNAWWSQPRFKIYTDKIREFVNFVEDNGVDITKKIKEMVSSPKEIIKMIHTYGELIEKWPHVVKSIIQLKSELQTESDDYVDQILDHYEREMDSLSSKLVDEVLSRYEKSLDEIAGKLVDEELEKKGKRS